MDRFDAALDFLDRRRSAALRVAVAFLVVSAALWLGMPQQAAQARHGRTIHRTTHHAPSFYYGVDATKMTAAIAKIWPQMNGAYCGVATAMAMVNYEDELRHLPLRFTSRNNQAAIATANQTVGGEPVGLRDAAERVRGRDEHRARLRDRSALHRLHRRDVRAARDAVPRLYLPLAVR